MQIPETPQTVTELNLMMRLDQYANGTASWDAHGAPVGESGKKACRTLHTNLTNLVDGVFAYMLDRVTAREMETFTMHDRVHGRKVAHLMWHILKPERRELLTPPEIGMLIVAAHLHDLGMGLSPAERAARLAPESDLWDKLEMQSTVREAIDNLRNQIGDEKTSEPIKLRAEQQLYQAEEAMLTQDTRERHATKTRYEEILRLLADFHERDPTKIPDIDASLSFDGDSYRDKLIHVCISHNEDADALVGNDERNLERPRFPKDFPVGRCNADLHMVAAALRIADILDFDRERTPPVLFHYLLPTALSAVENRSILEWGKHLAISNWHVEREAIVFRGRCQSHIIHHAIVQFCTIITDELKATHATFSPLGEEDWPFELPLSVKADIHEEGYRYVPYKFELDDERVYSLLMGGAIYDNPLVAVRELVQNAVDACKLRDSLTRLYEDYEEPGKTNRIFIRYEEPTTECPVPKLIVKDTGTGMDAYTLERYFLQIGKSYYDSSDFNQFRVQLRKKDLDFAPVSEFGIGFLSTFLLADHVEVETALWEPVRGDTTKRTLSIDGPTRLIRLDEQRNAGAGRFKGTRIILFLTPKIRQGDKLVPASWEEIKQYLVEVCQDLPYRLNLSYESAGGETEDVIDPLPLTVTVPTHLESACLRIPVNDHEFGLEGEIVLINPYVGKKRERDLMGGYTILDFHKMFSLESILLRGGFKVGEIDTLPRTILSDFDVAGARLRFTWEGMKGKRYLAPNLARNDISDKRYVEDHVFKIWLTYLLNHCRELQPGHLYRLHVSHALRDKKWLEEFSAASLYRLARQDWILHLQDREIDETSLNLWEEGKGEPLPMSFLGLGSQLLNLVLPRVTKLQQKSRDTHLLPPVQNWRLLLENCKDYISSPLGWSHFCDFEKDICNFLYYHNYDTSYQPRYLNGKYQDRLADWDDEGLWALRALVHMLATSGISQVIALTSSNFTVFNRAIETVGDLAVGGHNQSFVLGDLEVIEIRNR